MIKIITQGIIWQPTGRHEWAIDPIIGLYKSLVYVVPIVVKTTTWE